MQNTWRNPLQTFLNSMNINMVESRAKNAGKEMKEKGIRINFGKIFELQDYKILFYAFQIIIVTLIIVSWIC